MARTPKPATTGLVLSGTPRVNLLPPQIIERRLQAALTRRWLAGLVASLVAVGAVVGGAQFLRAGAEASLLAEQDRTLQLTTELAGYVDVTTALSNSAALAKYRAEAMGSDLEWQSLSATLQKQLPAGVVLSIAELTPGANPVDTSPGVRAVGLTARLTLDSSDPIDQDKVVDKLRKLDFTIDADAGTLEATPDEGLGYRMVVTFVADQTIYSGKFAKEALK
ncbi:MAG: hypothetical protein VB036_18110 [Propionicimonas sp.]|nr:hypothetical protein [Propionicimonas sp.]